jgi:hypothetical protein
MLSVQEIGLFVFGLVLCFMGYSIFRGILPLWGFLIFGWIGYTLLPTYLPSEAGNLMAQASAFVIAGIIGAIIARPLYFVTIFLTGAVFGALLGVMVGSFIEVGGIMSLAQLERFVNMSFPPNPTSTIQYALMFVAALIVGALAISFQKNLIILSSAYLGSAAIVSGLSSILAGYATGGASRGAIMLLAWLVIGTIGMFAQNLMDR